MSDAEEQGAKVDPPNLGRDLLGAVAYFDVDRVRSLLEAKADPNYSRGNEEYYQPTTPLRMVVFRISDCNLDRKVDWPRFDTIAEALMDAGADLLSAMIVARSRYGRWIPPAWEQVCLVGCSCFVLL